MKRSRWMMLVAILVVAFLIGSVLTACGNKQLLDFNQKFEYAYVRWPDGTAEKLELKSWKDYDGEQIQITTDEGTYLFHSANCVLAHE